MYFAVMALVVDSCYLLSTSDSVEALTLHYGDLSPVQFLKNNVLRDSTSE